MEKNRLNGITGAGFFIAIGLVALGWFMYSSARYVKSRDRVVNVKGLAEREVMADIAIWPITFKQGSNNLESLYRDMEGKQKTLLEFLEKSGFTKDEITTGQFVTNDRATDSYSSQNVTFRYISKNTVTVFTLNIINNISNVLEYSIRVYLRTVHYSNSNCYSA